MEAKYPQPGTHPWSNQRAFCVERACHRARRADGRDIAVSQLDELMNYYDVRQYYTKELGRALAYEYDRRVAR